MTNDDNHCGAQRLNEKCNFCINPNLIEAMARREEAVRLFKEGLGPIEIGARLNLPPGEIRRHIREIGYVPSQAIIRKRVKEGRIEKGDIQAIREWVKKGWIEKEEVVDLTGDILEKS